MTFTIAQGIIQQRGLIVGRAGENPSAGRREVCRTGMVACQNSFAAQERSFVKGDRHGSRRARSKMEDEEKVGNGVNRRDRN